MSEVQSTVSPEETAKLAEVSELVGKAKDILSGLKNPAQWIGTEKGIYQLIEGVTINQAIQMLGSIKEDIPRNTKVQVPS